MSISIWLEPNVAQAGIWAAVGLCAIGACIWLRHELFPRRVQE
jgi:hypothetical protein